jgi:hypothetical protein
VDLECSCSSDGDNPKALKFVVDEKSPGVRSLESSRVRQVLSCCCVGCVLGVEVSLRSRNVLAKKRDIFEDMVSLVLDGLIQRVLQSAKGKGG